MIEVRSEGHLVLNITSADVRSAPFPHVIKQGVLPALLYSRLRADFPTSASFAQQGEASEGRGSRTGKGTGFDIYRGDQAYDRLIADSSAWADFDRYINSAEFVMLFADTFGAYLDELECSVAVNPGRYERSFVEQRDVLSEKMSFGERLRALLPSKSGSKKDATLFTRLDIEQSLGGYAKPPHCDRPNRLASLIVYFTDLQREGISGGELNLYAPKEPKPIKSQERHPKPADVNVVATLAPKENLGVFFPCSNNSYHGVNAVQANGKARDFLYINISADIQSCWN